VPGLFGIYELGRRSLLAYQSAINTAGHNVANAGTEGFHRQRVELVATAPIRDLWGSLGTGVTVDRLQRVESRFLEYAIQREVPVMAKYTARSDALATAETSFGEPSGGGLTSLLDEFYGAWDDLASSPEDASVRESVVRMGATLADAVRNTRARLESQVTGLDGEIRRTLDDVNRAAAELARINARIQVTGAGGGVAPDLEDRRDVLVETLAELTGATAQIEDDGTATVWVSQRVVVQRDTVQEISFDPSEGAPPAIQDRPLDAHGLSGRIGGLLQARDEDLGTALRRLDEFAVRLAGDVNSLHEGGIDERGRPSGLFFVLTGVGVDGTERAAERLQVSADLVRDASRVAAGRSTAPGDGELALDIAALRNDPLGASGMLQSLIVDVGARSRESQDLLAGQSLVVESFKAQRESVSGVSLDEEATNLLRFQRSYEAAARVLTIADEMTQTVLRL